MIISSEQKPPMNGLGGVIHSFERGLDPWHRDAFPEEFKNHAPNQDDRKQGWFALDAWGNPIAFVADGTEI